MWSLGVCHICILHILEVGTSLEMGLIMFIYWISNLLQEIGVWKLAEPTYQGHFQKHWRKLISHVCLNIVVQSLVAKQHDSYASHICNSRTHTYLWHCNQLWLVVGKQHKELEEVGHQLLPTSHWFTFHQTDQLQNRVQERVVAVQQLVAYLRSTVQLGEHTSRTVMVAYNGKSEKRISLHPPLGMWELRHGHEGCFWFISTRPEGIAWGTSCL